MNLSRRKFLKANRAMLALPFLHSLAVGEDKSIIGANSSPPTRS